MTYYSNFKLFYYPEKLENLRKGVVTAPVHLRIKPTNTCNHSCWYCGYQNDTSISLGEELNKKDYIPQAKMVELCEDLIEMQVKAVTFSGGGEPLTYKFFTEFADRILAGGICLGLLTNGAKLRGEKAQTLADRASWVRVSMDGWDDASYSHYRNVKDGEFTKIVANLASFARIKGTTVLGVALNVDARNNSHIEEFVQKIKDVGVDHIKIGGCIVDNDSHANNRYHAPFFQETVARIEGLKSKLEDADFHIINAYHEMPERFLKDYQVCSMLQMLTVIGADLNVYTCQDKAYTKSGLLGSIANRRFIDFWHSRACKEALNSLNPAQACRHHCVAEGKNRLLLDYLKVYEGHVPFV